MRNFRCFSDCSIRFDAPITLIEGNNGTGKTSLLEALYYAAYLRSFRTIYPTEMIAFDQQAFTIGIDGASSDHTSWHLHLGCSYEKRLVKKNNYIITSYKELLTFYRVMHIIEDDMHIVKGSPKSRRSFMDQSLMLYDYGYANIMRHYKKALSHRNALLSYGKTQETIWLYQMWSYARHIVASRSQWIHHLQQEANALLASVFPDMHIELRYVEKHQTCDTFQDFHTYYIQSIADKEAYSKRVRFGPHLDDLAIYLHNTATRSYASRGQQKLVMVILKLAAVRLVHMSVVLLVDDMFADFDAETIQKLLDILAHKSHQIIMTSPGMSSHVISSLAPYDHHTVSISSAKKTDIKEMCI